MCLFLKKFSTFDTNALTKGDSCPLVVETKPKSNKAGTTYVYLKENDSSLSIIYKYCVNNAPCVVANPKKKSAPNGTLITSCFFLLFVFPVDREKKLIPLFILSPRQKSKKRSFGLPQRLRFASKLSIWNAVTLFHFNAFKFRPKIKVNILLQSNRS